MYVDEKRNEIERCERRMKREEEETLLSLSLFLRVDPASPRRARGNRVSLSPLFFFFFFLFLLLLITSVDSFIFSLFYSFLSTRSGMQHVAVADLLFFLFFLPSPLSFRDFVLSSNSNFLVFTRINVCTGGGREGGIR